MKFLDVLFRLLGEPLKGLFRKEPEFGSMEMTMDYVRRCLWKEDISIERMSFIDGGSFDAIKGKAYHSVNCCADGPNKDNGKTFHHAWIGYWDDFESFQGANTFALELREVIKNEIGIEVPIYISGKEAKAHSSWVLGKRKTRPRGHDVGNLPVTFKPYEY